MADLPAATMADFTDQCSIAQADVKAAHSSLLRLWQIGEHVPHPFASLLIEPLVTDMSRIHQRLDMLRAVAEAFERRPHNARHGDRRHA